jgi:LPS export ABC transporter protein LptC
MTTFLLFTFYSLLFLLLLSSCHFDYGNEEESSQHLPDITMNNLSYTHVEDGKPQVRFSAKTANRYENTHSMELEDYTFQQFDKGAGEVDAEGSGGKAKIDTDTLDATLENKVKIDIKTEKMSIEADALQWKNKEKTMTATDNSRVRVTDQNGSDFMGNGFQADANDRTFSFSGPIHGKYVHDDDSKDKNKDGK